MFDPCILCHSSYCATTATTTTTPIAMVGSLARSKQRLLLGDLNYRRSDHVVCTTKVNSKLVYILGCCWVRCLQKGDVGNVTQRRRSARHPRLFGRREERSLRTCDDLGRVVAVDDHPCRLVTRAVVYRGACACSLLKKKKKHIPSSSSSSKVK